MIEFAKSADHPSPALEEESKKGGKILIVPNLIVPDKEALFLCKAAEPRLKFSAKEGLFVNVNDTFIVKIEGKVAGLPFNDENVGGMELKWDRWYMPEDKKVRREITRAFIRGERKIIFEKETSWAEVREVEKRRLFPRKLMSWVSRGLKGVAGDPDNSEALNLTYENYLLSKGHDELLKSRERRERFKKIKNFFMGETSK